MLYDININNQKKKFEKNSSLSEIKFKISEGPKKSKNESHRSQKKSF